MFSVAVEYIFFVKCLHIPGYKHGLADSISRLLQPGEFDHVKKYIDVWYLCYCNIPDAFEYFSMLNHKSISSLICMLPQVMNWRRKNVTLTAMS